MPEAKDFKEVLSVMDIARLNVELDKAHQGLQTVNKDMQSEYPLLNSAVKEKLIAEEKIHVLRNRIKSLKVIADEIREKIKIIKYFIKAERE
jgi:septation ring formation regulator EzrA